MKRINKAIESEQISFQDKVSDVKLIIEDILNNDKNGDAEHLNDKKIDDIYVKINELIEELVVEYGIDSSNIDISDIDNELTKLAIIEIIGNKNKFQTSKVSKSQSIASQNGEFGISLNVGGKDHAIVDMKLELIFEGNIEYYDTVVQDAIGTLMDYNGGNNVSISPAQIYRKMAGLEPGDKVSKNCEDDIINSVDKMRWTKAWIDFKDQVGKHKALSIGVDDATLEGALVQADKISAKIGGHKKLIYHFYRPPLAYIYSQKIHQIATVESKLLETSGSGNKGNNLKIRRNNKEFICLKHYLAKEIEYMKYQKRNRLPFETRRKYDTIFKTIGVQDVTAKQKRRLREDIDYILTLWVERSYIRKYEVYKNGRAYAGIKIFL